MLKLYDNELSANCYKVRLLFAHLGIDYEIVPVSVLGDRWTQRGEAFAAKSPILRIPLVECDDGSHLSESLAILYYFADGTPLWPDSKRERAEVLRWMAFEQNQIVPNIAAARFRLSIQTEPRPAPEQIAMWKDLGTRALQALERWLSQREFIATDRYTIADIAVFGYTHIAAEGGFELEPLPAVRRWLDRVRAQPGFVAMRAAG